MSCRAVLFALSPTDLAHLRELTTDSARNEFIGEVIEPRDLDTPMAAAIDKAWDAIHRCFGDGELHYEGGEYPLNHLILGGERLYEGDDYEIILKTAEQVRDIADRVIAITETDLRARYRRINTRTYDMPLSDDDEGYTWENFAELQAFYPRAAAAGRAVVFTVDL